MDYIELYRLSLLAPLLFGSNLPDALSQKNYHDNKIKYNVLFIAIDDLNDWVGFLGGHPQTITPNMDRLAGEGMVFERAYCSAPVSNPSRASLLTGIQPSKSGIYNNNQPFRESPVLKDAITLPRWFSNHGYYSMARGKIFHSPNGPLADPQSWDLLEKTFGGYGETSSEPGKMVNGMPYGSLDANFDWGPTDAKFEETADYLNAKWAAEQLTKDYDKPFFLACGIFRPHLPWFVPQEFFDKFNPPELILPEINENDYDDIPSSAPKPSKDYFTVKKAGKQQDVIQAYLACINYADACVGTILDALSKSKYANNTIIVLWGDHGWHLGEKLRYKKSTLWDEACRMPLIIKVPGITSPGSRCKATVSLLDIFPTLTELCEIPSNPTNEGRSIVPLLKNPRMRWNYPVITTMGFNRHAIRDERYCYIKYDDGSEELYDHKKDPLEWYNLAKNDKYKKIKKRLEKFVPIENAQPAPSKSGYLLPE